ncbi:transcriptional regulator, TetR family [Nocardioidaceae bacterium Broad-1]|nr:transcriptional regulator, TetR family [Nocardioidaceae bacterium Broad-1]
MDTARYTAPRAGRPRHIPDRSQIPAREQILDAAARLFTGQGFAATSTREIADLVGIRQASLYYHFAGKDDILGELLEKTVRPTLDSLDDLAPLTPEARLYTLAYRDARVLAELEHNIGMLPTHPDVAGADACREYEIARQQLRAAYGALGIAIASDAVISTVSQEQLGGIIIQQVEGVVRTRAESDEVSDVELHAVAATCLRICGVPEDRARAAARE